MELSAISNENVAMYTLNLVHFPGIAFNKRVKLKVFYSTSDSQITVMTDAAFKMVMTHH